MSDLVNGSLVARRVGGEGESAGGWSIDKAGSTTGRVRELPVA